MDNQIKVKKKAEARALKLLREWRSGKSYRQLAKKLGLSFGRVRELVRRGKDLEERDSSMPKRGETVLGLTADDIKRHLKNAGSK